MKVLFALLVMTFCLAGMAQAAIPPAVNIFGEDLYELVLLASHNGGDKNPWGEGRGPGGTSATKSKGDYHPWEDCNGQGGSSGG